MRLTAVLAVIALLAGLDARADDKSACEDVLGTYLTDNTAKDGDFASRSLLSFASGGLVLFADSGESGAGGFAAFTEGSGAWRCIADGDGKVGLKAVTLDFIAPAEGAAGKIGRLDFDLSYSAENNAIHGTATLYFVPLDADPLAAEQLKDGLQFEIDGRRVEAP